VAEVESTGSAHHARGIDEVLETLMAPKAESLCAAPRRMPTSFALAAPPSP
jgi:hypothetical protein